MSDLPVRKPAVIRKRFPLGWLVLGLLGVAVAVFVVIRKNAPVLLSVTTPTVFKAGERNPLVSASGYLVARHRATLSAKVPGRLDWLGVEEGSRVQKGQIIARLEAPDLEATRDQTAVNLEQAEADLVTGRGPLQGGHPGPLQPGKAADQQGHAGGPAAATRTPSWRTWCCGRPSRARSPRSCPKWARP